MGWGILCEAGYRKWQITAHGQITERTFIVAFMGLSTGDDRPYGQSNHLDSLFCLALGVFNRPPFSPKPGAPIRV